MSTLDPCPSAKDTIVTFVSTTTCTTKNIDGTIESQTDYDICKQVTEDTVKTTKYGVFNEGEQVGDETYSTKSGAENYAKSLCSDDS